MLITDYDAVPADDVVAAMRAKWAETINKNPEDYMFIWQDPKPFNFGEGNRFSINLYKNNIYNADRWRRMWSKSGWHAYPVHILIRTAPTLQEAW